MAYAPQFRAGQKRKPKEHQQPGKPVVVRQVQVTYRTNARLRAQRERLFREQGGLCHWCKCELVLLPPEPRRKEMPANAATIDHLRSRFDPLRREPCQPGERRRVLACNKCNSERCQREQQEKAAEQKRRSEARGALAPLPNPD